VLRKLTARRRVLPARLVARLEEGYWLTGGSSRVTCNPPNEKGPRSHVRDVHAPKCLKGTGAHTIGFVVIGYDRTFVICIVSSPVALGGVDMADEASETFGGGLRNWLGAVGFCAVLIGAEMLRENTLPLWIGIVLIVVGLPIFLLPFGWRLIAKRPAIKPQVLEYLSNRDTELGSAIISVARYSAWGRWYAAQHLVNSGSPVGEQHFYQIAAGQVMEEITNGNLEVRGRRPDPDRLGYEIIDRTHWRSS
jgi:hypothetical protein